MSKNKYPLFLLVLLLIFTIAIDVSAQTTYSLNPSTYMPIIMKNFRNAFLVDTPSGTLAVFSSTATTNGAAGGRTGMNAICQNEDPDAFFCSIQMIENGFATTGVFFVSPFSDAWVDKPVTQNQWTTNACDGWSSDNNLADGPIIEDNGRRTGGMSCEAVISVTCCKWSP